MSNSLDPDQNRHSVDPDLGPNCLQMLSAEVAASKERVKKKKKKSSFEPVHEILLLLATETLRSISTVSPDFAVHNIK